MNVNLFSIGRTEKEALELWVNNPDYVKNIASKNQELLEIALGTRTSKGRITQDSERDIDFNVMMPSGYLPIVGDLVIPAGSGYFAGRGSFARRKQLTNTQNRDNDLINITEHITALCPVGGSDLNGILTQCGSSVLNSFSVSGVLKNKNDGGNGIIFGHTPPLTLPDGQSVVQNIPLTSQAYWAYQKKQHRAKAFYRTSCIYYKFIDRKRTR